LKFTQNLKDEIYQRLSSGESVSLLAREYGIRRETLQRWKKSGVKSKKRVNAVIKSNYVLTELQKKTAC